MRSLQFALLSIFFSLSSFVAASSSSSSSSSSPQLEILYWPLASSQPSVLAHVSYNPASLTSDVISYSPPSATDKDGHDLVRVGLYVSTPTNPKQWVGTLTSLSALQTDNTQSQQKKKPTLRLHLSAANDVYHVSVTSSSSDAPSSSKNLAIELVPQEAGPLPRLNRPVVVGPDSQNPEEVGEKTLFQKYWWAFLIVTVIAMSGSGEGGQ